MVLKYIYIQSVCGISNVVFFFFFCDVLEISVNAYQSIDLQWKGLHYLHSKPID